MNPKTGVNAKIGARIAPAARKQSAVCLGSWAGRSMVSYRPLSPPVKITIHAL